MNEKLFELEVRLKALSKMKTRFLSLLFLLAGTFVVAQKDEIKNLQKSIKGGNPQEIENAISAAEASVANATEDFKAQFYFYKFDYPL